MALFSYREEVQSSMAQEEWDSLLPTVHRHQEGHWPLDAFVIQLGENDLGDCTGIDLAHQAEVDLRTLWVELPTTTFLWLDWLELHFWHVAHRWLMWQEGR